VVGIAAGSTATLANLTIAGGLADEGAGIRNAGTLTVLDSTIRDNRATTGSGGGIRNSRGTLTVRESTIRDNTAGFNGGGISSTAGVVVLEDDLILGNSARLSGGGLVNDNDNNSSDAGSFTVTGGVIQGNLAGLTGGGVHNTANMTLSGVRILDNIARASGGGISGRSSVIINNNLFHMTLRDCTVSGNTALGDADPNPYHLDGDGRRQLHDQRQPRLGQRRRDQQQLRPSDPDGQHDQRQHHRGPGGRRLQRRH
jgi:predicted outer membrane repeat protein